MFRFSIRDILWLTVVVALAIGWAIEHWKSAGPLAEYRRQQKVAAEQAALHRQMHAEMQKAFQNMLSYDGPQSWEQAKAKSKELGAPQPVPMTAGN